MAWQWHAKPMGSYARGSTEGDDNACMITSKLMLDHGWTLEACAGLLGNIAGEGGLNPWQYEIRFTNELGRLPTRAEALATGYGMGLIGWTPCRKWCDPTNNYFPEWDLSTFSGYGPNYYDQAGNVRDGAAQTELIGRCMVGNGHRNFWVRGRHDWQGNLKSIDAEDYIRLTDVSRAAIMWLWCAEYPSSIHPPNDPRPTENRRENFALAWYQHLIDIGFVPSPEAIMPIWLMAKTAQYFSNGC